MREAELEMGKTTLHSQTNFKPKACIIYILFYICVFLAFFTNYLFTVDAMKENKDFFIIPRQICANKSNLLEDCLKKIKSETNNTKISYCESESDNVQKCYDGISEFNRKCYMYLSELSLCVKKASNTNNSTEYLKNKCRNIFEDVCFCNTTSIIKPDDLFTLVSSN
jgi:hypothetical protein